MSAKNLFFIFILMLAMFLGTICMIVYYDIGGVQRYVADVPFINKLIPEIDDIDTIEAELNTYSYNKLLKYTLSLYKENDENKKQIKALNDEIFKWSSEDGVILKTKYDEIAAQLDASMDEVIRLKEYEDAYVKLKKQKDELDKIVALNDTTKYKTYYESINAEDAKKIYELVVTQQQMDLDFQNYVSSFAAMDPAKAGLVVEQLVRTDFEVVLDIFRNLESDAAADILNNVDSTYTSMITKGLANRSVK